MRAFILILFSFLHSFIALADEQRIVRSEQVKSISLTIYPDDLALITETRIIDLPIGKSTIVFEGVNENMIPATALLRQFQGLTIERNFDMELLNKANLFERSLGKTVTITKTDRLSGAVSREQVEIISANANGGVLFLTKDGIEAYQCSGLGEGTLFDEIPKGLNNVPKLSIDIDSTKSGKRELVISYLAEGFNWQADYRLDLDHNSADFSGWLTIENDTGQSFKNASLAVIAGVLNINDETYAPLLPQKNMAAMCWPRTSTKTPIAPLADLPMPLITKQITNYDSVDEIIVTGSRAVQKASYAPAPPKEENLSEYKLYRMSEALNLTAQQTKQIRFIDIKQIEYKPVYSFSIDRNSLSTNDLKPSIVEYRLDNSKDGKMAKSLPAGTYRVFSTTKNGSPFYLGEDDLDNLAIGLPVKIKANTSYNVQMQTNVLDRKQGKIKGRHAEVIKVEHNFFNAHNEAVEIEFKPDRRWQWQFYEIKNPSKKPDNSNELKWTFTLAAEKSSSLTYTAILN